MTSSCVTLPRRALYYSPTPVRWKSYNRWRMREIQTKNMEQGACDSNLNPHKSCFCGMTPCLPGALHTIHAGYCLIGNISWERMMVQSGEALLLDPTSKLTIRSLARVSPRSSTFILFPSTNVQVWKILLFSKCFHQVVMKLIKLQSAWLIIQGWKSHSHKRSRLSLKRFPSR